MAANCSGVASDNRRRRSIDRFSLIDSLAQTKPQPEPGLTGNNYACVQYSSAHRSRSHFRVDFSAVRIDAWLQKAAGTGWLLRHQGLAALAQLRPRVLAGLAAIAAAPDRALKNSNHGDGILPSLSTRSLISAGASSNVRMLTLLAAPARTRSSGDCWPWRVTGAPRPNCFRSASLSTGQIPPFDPLFRPSASAAIAGGSCQLRKFFTFPSLLTSRFLEKLRKRYFRRNSALFSPLYSILFCCLTPSLTTPCRFSS